jgi:uncharacterized metal-binding protein
MNDHANSPSGKSTTIVYACSGCSDAGETADRIARQLARTGAAEMSCLAGIGGRVKTLMRKGEQAARILVVDGCPLNCAAHTLKLAGFQNFEHLELHKLGMRKGSCPVTDASIAQGVQAAQEMLAQIPPAPPTIPAQVTPPVAAKSISPESEGPNGSRILSLATQEMVSESQSR